ncbi:DnaJ domain-containing protein [Dyella jiangningensis]
MRQDGLPYAQQRAIDDHGIALYFEYKGKPMCFACDRYTRMEANMRAIELTIAALRGIERWGASDMLERAFTGFAQLEHSPTQQWWDVLGINRNATRDEIETAWRRLRSAHHPDRDGGDHDIFLTVKAAYEKAMKESTP